MVSETPRPTVVGLDAWARLEGVHGEYDKLRHRGRAGPAGRWGGEPKHQLAAAAMGLKVGEDFTVKAAFGTDATWRVAEIKHKYLHALHDVMENFQAQFPDARGFYTLKMKEGDIKPASIEIKRVSRATKARRTLSAATLPMGMVATPHGGDAISSPTMSDRWIMTSTAAPARQGNATPLMRWSNNIVRRARMLDTYTAWTVATMDAFDVLVAVFGKLVIPRSCIDELRGLRGRDQFGGENRSMTIAWHDGQYIRQEHTRRNGGTQRLHFGSDRKD